MHRIILYSTAVVILASAGAARAAEEKVPACTAMDRPCQMKQIEVLAGQIQQADWKDQTLRELAKSYAYENQTEKAISLIDKITNPDTKAMTIRGIGMAAASGKWSRGQYNSLFSKLTEKASQIDHTPSRGIAFTYIAMSQAFAGDDNGARKTAASMDNAALRNKAYGETAEIQAERGDLKNVLLSLDALDSSAYKNKAYDTVSRIFLDKAMIEEAYTCASRIDNAYLKAKSIQRILNAGNSEEADMEPKADLSKGTE
jgi:hypothetical protein